METNAVEIMAFPPAEASRLSGLSVPLLRRWAKDLYAPHWETSGLYTFKDLVALRALSALRKQHRVPRQQLRRAGAYLRGAYPDPWSRLKFGVGPNRRVYFWDPKDGAWLSADESNQEIAASLALDEIQGQLEREVRESRRRPESTYGTFVQDRGICGNKPRIAGTRIPIFMVRECIDDGLSDTKILELYPSLVAQDIAAVRKLPAA